MIHFQRTDSSSADFIELVRLLDAELAIRDGDEHAFYDQFNKIDSIKHCIVGYLNGLPIGCGAIKGFNDKAMEVKRMYILPEYRGRNYATELLKALEKWITELNFNQSILETGIRQPEAIALYTKNNYLRIPNYGQYEGKSNSVCFSKQLDPAVYS